MHFTHSDGNVDARIDQVIVAGWTGRDSAAVAHHIEELQHIGVSPPSQTPLFYLVSRSLLVQTTHAEVLGPDTSGEAEPLILRQGDTLWLGLGSDHTDRAMETQSVAASKQACPKVCAPELWRFDDVADHLDALKLRSWIKDDGNWQLYQEGTLDAIMPLQRLVDDAPLGDHAVMLCGTLPALGGIRSARSFRAELEDPVLNCAIMLEYETTPLPIVS